MRPRTLVEWVTAACRRMADSRAELTDLDAAAGDGDLGVTVTAGSREVVAALAELPAGSGPGTVLRDAGAAFARGNPSSFAALVGAGLVAAAGAVDGDAELDRAAVATALSVAADRVAERGRAKPGDRTVLDAVLPSIEALRAAPAGGPAGLAAMVTAARDGVAATRTMTPVRGRAAWVGERGSGVPDAGATAYLRFLEALAVTAPD